VRFEQSKMLSKQAAVAIISDRGPAKPADEALAKIVRANLTNSKRKPTAWLRAWLQFSEDPKSASEQWGKLVAEERALLARSPKETSPAISAAMLRLHIAWLEKLDRADEALLAMRELFELDWAKSDDPSAVKNLLRSYNRKSTNSRLAVIRALGGFSNNAGAAALCRFVRFEKSPLMAKTAAAVLFDNSSPDKLPNKKLVDIIRKNIAGSKREPARWLLTWLQFSENPTAAADSWAKLVDAESKVLEKHTKPPESSTEVLTAMLRLQTAWLEKLDRKEDAVVSLGRLVKLEKTGNPQTLAKLLVYLIEQEAWDMIDELAVRFASRFDRNANLLYLLAEAQAGGGKKEIANNTARKALRLNPGVQVNRLGSHLMLAFQLRGRGLFPWAKNEYLHVAATAPKGSSPRIIARSSLAEMLHDQADDLAAAKVLVLVVAEAGAAKPVRLIPGMSSPAAIRSRMNYFFACHWKTQGDAAKHREYLDKALAADPDDIDVLIALYKLTKQNKEQLDKTRALIKKTAAKLRAKALGAPHDPSSHNQYAWLVGNTEGNFDEALEFSNRSIALQPESGGYYDTLAHVYFGKGDYVNAVKTQEKAAKFEPHSGLLSRKLKLFRDKLAETQKQPEMPPEEKTDDGK
jgi:tetratricopeptide (TPR) repeat protein